MLELNVTWYVPVLSDVAAVAPEPRTSAPAELTTAHFGAAACARAGTASVAPSAASTRPARRRPRAFMFVLLRLRPQNSAGNWHATTGGTERRRIDIRRRQLVLCSPRSSRGRAASCRLVRNRHQAELQAVGLPSTYRFPPVGLRFRY